ncbi:MAG: ParB/RepB/Spo0J family partition protein [Candidatus Saganbacteria bacterium]|nr:ParB/RepB/Spo0J family partition protein [Candidatus Saganbacteria bacterium]
MSTNAKRGLGRGLSALIPSGGETEKAALPFTSGRAVLQVDISKIIPNPRQPRKSFDHAKLNELASSIKEQGVTSPVLLRKNGDMFELVAGERRLRATKKAGITTIPAIIKDFTDEQSLEIAIVENLQREDLNPMEEALAYKALSLEFKLTHDQIAKKVSRDRSTVTNTMRLLDLPKEIRDSIASGQITAGHARPLLTIQGREKQIKAWEQILKANLSVRDVEAILGVKKERSKGKTKTSKRSALNPFLADVVEKMTESLGTKISLRGDENKGKIEVDYFSKEDLERIAERFTAP